MKDFLPKHVCVLVIFLCSEKKPYIHYINLFPNDIDFYYYNYYYCHINPIIMFMDCIYMESDGETDNSDLFITNPHKILSFIKIRRAEHVLCHFVSAPPAGEYWNYWDFCSESAGKKTKTKICSLNLGTPVRHVQGGHEPLCHTFSLINIKSTTPYTKWVTYDKNQPSNMASKLYWM